MTINECEGARIGVILACARNGGTNNNVSVSACNGGKGAHGCLSNEEVSERAGGKDTRRAGERGMNGGDAW